MAWGGDKSPSERVREASDETPPLCRYYSDAVLGCIFAALADIAADGQGVESPIGVLEAAIDHSDRVGEERIAAGVLEVLQYDLRPPEETQRGDPKSINPRLMCEGCEEFVSVTTPRVADNSYHMVECECRIMRPNEDPPNSWRVAYRSD